MLDKIPPEIVSQITYHVISLDPPSITVPPLNLLLSCRTVYEAISPTINPRLYARVFRRYFDVDAAERRLGLGSASEGADKLNARELTVELATRVRSLMRLRGMVRRGNVRLVDEHDLWAIYFMLIENDGKNSRHLFGSEAIFDLSTFLELYHEQQMLAAAVEPGYPAETVGRSLAMWIAWLVDGSGSSDETSEQREERMFVLRPYVFAAQRYELYFAPWTLPDLPLLDQSNQNPSPNPFVADLQPRSRLVTVEHYGRRIELCPPFLAHAAILRFFYRKPGDDLDDTDAVAAPYMALGGEGNGGVLTVAPDENGDGVIDGMFPRLSIGNPSAVTSMVDSDGISASTSSLSSHHLIANSQMHDRDFARLAKCYDPSVTPGMKRRLWRGCWNGCWEGTFSFFDFDAFREMLAGQARALYDGAYGEQAQVWRITETWVRRKGWVRKVKEESDEDDDEEEGEDEADVVDKMEVDHDEGTIEQVSWTLGSTSSVIPEARDADSEAAKARAFTDLRARKAEKKRKSKGSKGLPLSGPMVNAGFPTDRPAGALPDLASAAAEAATLRETIRTQVDAIEGYEAVPDEEIDEMLEEDDGGESAGLEMILTGTGHSAWGRFILKGRVRAWDGMASLVKEYAPDSRGKWIYRGYVVSGDIFVGRWRDTFTPEAFVGYEGTFILNRR
ncbi:hypothetical protein IAR55_005759 [Kwoniella newhampshirensis]|uniref:F-box domain-containing protein n=1 Tax=Kwoniella newhampshirensis TaxID=1651941 RepID=A0AAW0YKS8_9TREE